MSFQTQFVPPGTIKQGYLTKSPPLHKKKLHTKWKKRWCIFFISGDDLSLHYYEDEAAFYHSLPKKKVSMNHCIKIEMDLQHTNYRHVFSVHLPERIFYFSAPSHFEMTQWVEAFCTHLKLGSGYAKPPTPMYSPTHVPPIAITTVEYPNSDLESPPPVPGRSPSSSPTFPPRPPPRTSSHQVRPVTPTSPFPKRSRPLPPPPYGSNRLSSGDAVQVDPSPSLLPPSPPCSRDEQLVQSLPPPPLPPRPGGLKHNTLPRENIYSTS